jgi:hypothetical protein
LVAGALVLGLVVPALAAGGKPAGAAGAAGQFGHQGHIGQVGRAVAVSPAPCGTAPVVTADRPAVPNRHAGNAFDGQSATFFFSSYDNWQYLQVDFGCVGTFTGLRRLMTLGFSQVVTNRGPQGEAASYSLDGQQWTPLTGSTTSGWASFVNYRPHAWHSLPYGWSPTLELDVPVQARYVRFSWDGAGDLLHEVDIDFSVPAPLSATLTCDTGIVSCFATAAGGNGGYTFAWTPLSNATVTYQNTSGSTSTVVGQCTSGSTYKMQVTVRDSAGASRTRNASRSCLGVGL